MSDIAELDARFGDNIPICLPQRQAPAGQATQVEQARAIAEVRAAVMIAMDRPRDRTAAIAEMREVCGIMGLAERAFFRVPRGGQQVNGESIHLARELARCWGNIDYGVKELVRDDAKGQSELLAFAWDLQTNARNEITFIIPHVRGKNNNRLTGTQEIYENNASFAGRRLREAIFAVLPVWFKAEAADLCHKTLAEGGGKPLVQRIADLRAAFEAIGVTTEQLEQKRGRKVDNFLPEDVAALRVVYGSLKRDEVTIAEEFPRDDPEPRPTGSKLDTLEQIAASEPQSHSPAGPRHPKEPHGAVSVPAGDTNSSAGAHQPSERKESREGEDAAKAPAEDTAITDMFDGKPRPAADYRVKLTAETANGWAGWHAALLATLAAGAPCAEVLRQNRQNIGIFEQVDAYKHAMLMQRLESGT